MKINIVLLAAGLAMGMVFQGFSQSQNRYYNDAAGQNEIRVPMVSESGEVKKDKNGVIQYKEAERDHYGNAQGSQFDLAVDGAFKGQTIAVLQLYTGESFDFVDPKAALEQKGFNVYRWLNAAPPVEEFKAGLAQSCQLWVISSNISILSEAHIQVIKEFFDSGKGVYIWGDNEPYYADANRIAEALFGASMHGNLYGDQVVKLAKGKEKIGILPGHLITTGLENVYEGITIATIEVNQDFTPLLYGSAGNLVSAAYEKNGKRAILDGGFTRLYVNWNTAGTDRFVKNAAAWLANVERFEEDLGLKE